MLDDSWDDSLSSFKMPDPPKPPSKYAVKDDKTKFTAAKDDKTKPTAAKDDKYNFPSAGLFSTNKQHSSIKNFGVGNSKSSRGDYLDNSDDHDALFSPASSASQLSLPSSPIDKKPFAFEELPVKDTKSYLSNFITDSADLEDSILGELLGGGKSKTNPSSSSVPKPPNLNSSNSSSNHQRGSTLQQKLYPLDADRSPSEKMGTKGSRNRSPPQAQIKKSVTPPKATKGSAYRDGLSAHQFGSFDIKDSSFGDIDSRSDKQQTNMRAANNSPYDSGAELQPPPHTKAERRSTDGTGALPSASIRSVDNDSDDRGTNKDSLGDGDGAGGGLSFIPSFMEQGRQNRRRRNLDAPAPVPETGASKLSDLDKMLGLGALTGGNVTPRKKIVDPFSALEQKIPAIEQRTGGTGFRIYSSSDDDSSSDEAILRRSRQERKDHFPTKSSTSSSSRQVLQAKEAVAVAAAAATVGAKDSSISSVAPSVPVKVTVDSLPVISRSPGHASLAALPSVTAGGGGATKTKTQMMEDNSSSTRGDNEDDLLDVSGIVRFDLEDTLLTSTLLPADKKDRGSTHKPKSTTIAAAAAIKSSESTVDNSFVGKQSSGWRPYSSSQLNDPNPLSQDASSDPPLVIRTSLNFLEGTGGSDNNPSLNSSTSRGTNSYNFQENLVRDRHTSISSTAMDRSSAIPSTAMDRSSAIPSTAMDRSSSIPSTAMDRSSAIPSTAMDRSSAIPSTAMDRSEVTFGAEGYPVKRSNPSHDTKLALDNDSTHASQTRATSSAFRLDATRDESELMRLREVEELKAKLAQTTTHMDRSARQHATEGADTAGYSSWAQFRSVQEVNVRLAQDNMDQQRTIALLESEVARLKDEANVKALRYQEDIIRMKDKYDGELGDAKLKSAMEAEALARRHEESLSALRKLHANEVDALKERFKSEEKFEQITGQLRTTTGSIRFIEEQLQVRQKGVEAIREGQIDARERLLADMEEKARERAELAEAEGYRLKGILSHMEHVVSSLREQGSDEKERLKMEHHRLQGQLHSFEAERHALQHRNMEELNYIKQRSKEVEIELLKLTQDKQAHYDAQADANRQLDSRKAEFSVYCESKSKSMDQRESRLAEEEGRLQRLRESVHKEKQALEDRRADAMRDIDAAEELRDVVMRTQKQLEQDKANLLSTSQAYKAALEELSVKEASFKEQYSALQEKEVVLREGFAQMKLAAAELTQRERGLSDAMQLIDRRKTALDQADHDVQLRRLTAATSYREWSSKQTVDSLVLARTSASGSYQLGSTGTALSSSDYSNHYHHPRHSPVDKYGSETEQQLGDNRYKIINYAHSGANSRAIHNSNEHAPPPPPTIPSNSVWLDALQSKLKGTGSPNYMHAGNGVSLPAEVRAAQSTLRQLRGQMSQVDASSSSVQRLLDEEEDFLKALQQHRKNTRPEM